MQTFRFGYSSPVTPRMTCEFRAVAALEGALGPSSSSAIGGGSAAAAAVAVPRVHSAAWDVDVAVLKRKSVPNFIPSDYKTARVFAKSRDGKTQAGFDADM